VSEGFQLRAPWYVRERENYDLRDRRALRPQLQMYDGTDFVTRLIADPGASLAYSTDDQWSYPVAVTPAPGAKGRDRFVTSRLVTTDLLKLYQPAHSRFYAVVVEVFCDAPGLPRAGSHTDIEVSFVMRRQHTCMTDDRGPIRQLAQKLLTELADEQYHGQTIGQADRDIRDLWWASEAERIRFEQDNAALFDKVQAHTEEQAWTAGPDGSRWVVAPAPGSGELAEKEEAFPMWRLPPRDSDCAAAKTRSLWFGLVPTYSADHWTGSDGKIAPKLDDHAIYQVRCLVTRKPRPGHEHCPPKLDLSEPSQPFRLASAYDPDGTKNRTVSVTAPDLRRLAARAGKKPGPGGLRITTPPQSGLSPVDFKSIPGAKLGSVGGGSICTFAFELFFLVALFLFLLFLPIVVLAFQLWWLLALRFCIPPSVSFKLLADYFAAGGLLTNLRAGGPNPDLSRRLDEVIGVHDAATEMAKNGSLFATDPAAAADLVAAMDPKDAQLSPVPPTALSTPADPLCPAG
jgi:hypothetical protein